MQLTSAYCLHSPFSVACREAVLVRGLLVGHPVLVALERHRYPSPPRRPASVQRRRRADVFDNVDILTAGAGSQASDILAERARNVDGRELGVGNRFWSDSLRR